MSESTVTELLTARASGWEVNFFPKEITAPMQTYNGVLLETDEDDPLLVWMLIVQPVDIAQAAADLATGPRASVDLHEVGAFRLAEEANPEFDSFGGEIAMDAVVDGEPVTVRIGPARPVEDGVNGYDHHWTQE